MSDQPDDPAARVRWVYSSQSPDEVRDRYEAWASDYDSDLTDTYDYSLPKTTVEDFWRWVPRTANVLDAGAGTGLVAIELGRLGYTNLVGIDISPAMLARAENLGLYAELHEMTLGEELSLATDRFDAVISVGTFTDGHAPASAFFELVRVTRPGGHIVAAIRGDIIDSHGFSDVFDELVSEKAWELVERTEPRAAMPKTEPDITAQTWCFQVQ